MPPTNAGERHGIVPGSKCQGNRRSAAGFNSAGVRYDRPAKAFEREHAMRLTAGAIVVLVLGQVAVLWPALKAASISPALATRAA